MRSFAIKHSLLIAALLSVVGGLIVGLIIMYVSGFNGLEGYYYLLKGAFKGLLAGDFKAIGNTLAAATPFIFTGLSVAFAFKTGLFNIGASGQYLLGGFIAVFVGVKFDLPPVALTTVAVLLAILAGAVWGLIPGLLKAAFNIHEVVICIMLNYTAMFLVQYLVKTYIPEPGIGSESMRISKDASLKIASLTNLTDGSNLSLGFFIGIIVIIILYILLEKTSFGYEVKAVGYNKFAARYAGIKANLNITLSMIIAGAIAGLGGATHYIGYTNHIKIGEIPQEGFEGIAVALIGLNAPFGVFLAALLFGILEIGSLSMSANLLIPSEIVDIVIAVIVYFSALSLVIQKVLSIKNVNVIDNSEASEAKSEVKQHV